MDEGLIETTFLIDLERELRRGEQGPVQDFLDAHAAVRLYITFTVAGELAASKSLSNRRRRGRCTERKGPAALWSTNSPSRGPPVAVVLALRTERPSNPASSP